MGQVYRARDTKLNRDIALKVLPDSFASDDERLARFTREAHTLASLNHSHIAQIYGLEESGGVRALVMELVDGDDLSQRIAHGPVPLDEMLPIAQQVAEALEAAHEQGIIHRDLKPANIKVRADGTVKVLDFGLAKAMEPPASSPNVSQSPTITTPAMTQAGMILGTAAYMSPEQAKGRAADKRSDVWAFGCVLYEMLTGRRAFEGDDVSDTLAAVLRGEPDWNALPANVPSAVRTLVQRCLVKDRRQRVADMSVARFVLTDPATLFGTAGCAHGGAGGSSQTAMEIGDSRGRGRAFDGDAGGGGRLESQAIESVAGRDTFLVHAARGPTTDDERRCDRDLAGWHATGLRCLQSPLRSVSRRVRCACHPWE